MKTEDWKIIDGNFIYALRSRGDMNRFWFQVQGGYDDNGKKISKKEIESISAFILTACNSHDELVGIAKNIIDVLDKFGEFDDGIFYYNHHFSPELAELHNKAKAAIAKARGEK